MCFPLQWGAPPEKLLSRRSSRETPLELRFGSKTFLKFENCVVLLPSTLTASDFWNFRIMSLCFPALITSDFWNLRIMSFCFLPLTTSIENSWFFKFENYVGLLSSTWTTSDFWNFWIMSFCFPALRTSDFWNLRIMSSCFPALTTSVLVTNLRFMSCCFPPCTACDLWNLDCFFWDCVRNNRDSKNSSQVIDFYIVPNHIRKIASIFSFLTSSTGLPY